MCLILIAWKVKAEYPLILAANRDEFYHRPTAAMHWWGTHPDVLAGKDLQAGGTWMGMSKTGRFAAITNYRQFPLTQQYSTSRGSVVKEFLTTNVKPTEYLEKLQAEGQEYEGFNLLFGTPAELYYYSNRGGAQGSLTPGVYGLSNHLLNTPWPKVERGKQLLKEQLSASATDLDQYLQWLGDTSMASDQQLPDTGIGLEKERWLSPMFIQSEGYGTRCSTVVCINNAQKFSVIEKGHQPSTYNRFEFQALPV
jgi:uncharacterized protein with NRDE domain